MQKVGIVNMYIKNISVWFNKDARKDNHDQKWSEVWTLELKKSTKVPC